MSLKKCLAEYDIANFGNQEIQECFVLGSRTFSWSFVCIAGETHVNMSTAQTIETRLVKEGNFYFARGLDAVTWMAARFE